MMGRISIFSPMSTTIPVSTWYEYRANKVWLTIETALTLNVSKNISMNLEVTWLLKFVGAQNMT